MAFTRDFLLGEATVAINAISMLSSGETVIRAMVSGLNINLQSAAAATQLVGLNLPNAVCGSIAIPDFTIYGMVANRSSDERGS